MQLKLRSQIALKQEDVLKDKEKEVERLSSELGQLKEESSRSVGNVSIVFLAAIYRACLRLFQRICCDTCSIEGYSIHYLMLDMLLECSRWPT